MTSPPARKGGDAQDSVVPDAIIFPTDDQLPGGVMPVANGKRGSDYTDIKGAANVGRTFSQRSDSARHSNGSGLTLGVDRYSSDQSEASATKKISTSFGKSLSKLKNRISSQSNPSTRRRSIVSRILSGFSEQKTNGSDKSGRSTEKSQDNALPWFFTSPSNQKNAISQDRQNMLGKVTNVTKKSIAYDLSGSELCKDVHSVKQIVRGLSNELTYTPNSENVPEELLDSSGQIIPRFIPALNLVYQRHIAAQQDFSSYMVLVMATTWAVACDFALFSESLSGGCTEGPMAFQIQVAHATILALSIGCKTIWGLLYRVFRPHSDTAESSDKWIFWALRLKLVAALWLAQLTGLFIVVNALEYGNCETDTFRLKAYRRMLTFVLTCKTYTMLPLASLQALWVVVLVAPVAWASAMLSSGHPHQWSDAVEQFAWLLIGGLLVFADSRRHARMRMRLYVESRVREDSNNFADVDREVLNHEMKQLVKASAPIAHKLRIDDLTRELENSSAKEEIDREHERLVGLYTRLACDNKDSSQRSPTIQTIAERFRKLLLLAEDESTRLASVMGKIHDEFSVHQEWSFVTRCPCFRYDTREKLHQGTIPRWWRQDAGWQEAHNELGLAEDKIDWFRGQAQWAMRPFRHLLGRAVQKFNAAETPDQLDLDPEEILHWWNQKHPGDLKEFPFSKEDRIGGEREVSQGLKHECVEHGRHVSLQLGPLKEHQRARAKVEDYSRQSEEDYPDAACREKYITDWLRGRAIFASPQALSMFFWYLVRKEAETGLRIVSCKNKLLSRPSGDDTSANIHLNVQFRCLGGAHHVAELQLLLENFVLAKNLEHQYYELRRAKRIGEVLNPIFDKPKKSNGTSSKSKEKPSPEENSSSDADAADPLSPTVGPPKVGLKWSGSMSSIHEGEIQEGQTEEVDSGTASWAYNALLNESMVAYDSSIRLSDYDSLARNSCSVEPQSYGNNLKVPDRPSSALGSFVSNVAAKKSSLLSDMRSSGRKSAGKDAGVAKQESKMSTMLSRIS